MTAATALVVQDGVVVNAVIVDIDTDRNIRGWSAPGGQMAVVLPDGSPAGIGWTYDGVTFTAPVDPDPSS